MSNTPRALPLALPPDTLIGSTVTLFPLVDSTNDRAMLELTNGGPDGLVIVADEQTAGRGRFARAWRSTPGADVMMSVGLRPPPHAAQTLSAVAGLAMSRTVDRLAGVESTIKWPNDVRVNGLKIAGVLIESRVVGEKTLAVVGIGINLVLDPAEWPEIAATATSVYGVSGRRVPRDDALTVLLEELDSVYGRVLGGEPVTAEWEERLDTIGKEVQLTPVPGGEPVRGLAVGVTEKGELVIESATGVRQHFNAGEVTSQAVRPAGGG